MLEQYTKRNSSIELLRIICMWMIILYHLSMHSYGEALGHNLLWDIVTNVFHIGVVCFILISGWYGIKATIRGRLSEKYLIDNQLRGPDSSSTLKKADETNLK